MSANPQQDDPFGLLKPPSKSATVDYEGMVRAEAERQGVDPDLALRIAKKESGFNPRAIGPVTRTGERAIGLMQLMPDTARKWKVNPLKAEENIRGGISELREQLIKYGSPQLGSAAYNAGPSNVDKHGGVPPFKETKGYVRNVAPQQDAGDPFGLIGEASSAPSDANPSDWQVVDEGKPLTSEQEQQIKGYNAAHATVQDAAGVDVKTAKGFVNSPHSEQVAHLLPTDEPAVTLHNAPAVPTDTVAIPADKITHTMVAARPLDLSDIKDKVLSDKVSPEQLTAEINKRIYSDLGTQYNLSPDEVKSYAVPYTVEQVKQALPGIKAELEQSSGTITHRLPGDYERQLGSLAQSKEHEHFIEQIKSLSDDDKELLARSLAAKGALPDDIKQALGGKHSYFTPSALLGTATGIPQDYITTADAGAEKSVGETLSGVARLNKYNPTADWINGLIDAYGQGLQEEGKVQSGLHKPKGVSGSLAQGVGEIAPDVAASLLVPESIPAHIAFWGGLGATKEAGRGGDVGDIAKAGLTNAAMVGAMKPLAPLAGAAGDTAKETIAKLGSRGAMGYAVGYGMARAEGASAADAHASGVQFAAMSAMGGKAEEKTSESPIPKEIRANADTRNIQQDVQTGTEAAKAEKPAEAKEEVKRVSPSDYAAARERILAKRQDENKDDPFGLLSEVSDAPKAAPITPRAEARLADTPNGRGRATVPPASAADVGEGKVITVKPSTPRSRSVSPESDTLLAAIQKLGFDATTAEGSDLAKYLSAKEGGRPGMVNNQRGAGGQKRGVDDLMSNLQSLGYPVEDGNHLLDLVRQEQQGKPTHSYAFDHAAAAETELQEHLSSHSEPVQQKVTSFVDGLRNHSEFAELSDKIAHGEATNEEAKRFAEIGRYELNIDPDALESFLEESANAQYPEGRSAQPGVERSESAERPQERGAGVSAAEGQGDVNGKGRLHTDRADSPTSDVGSSGDAQSAAGRGTLTRLDEIRAESSPTTDQLSRVSGILESLKQQARDSNQTLTSLVEDRINQQPLPGMEAQGLSESDAAMLRQMATRAPARAPVAEKQGGLLDVAPTLESKQAQTQEAETRQAEGAKNAPLFEGKMQDVAPYAADSTATVSTKMGNVGLRSSYTEKAEGGAPKVSIEAYTPDGKFIGDVNFQPNPDGTWSAANLFVNKPYRRNGVASAMYDLAESKGLRLSPSGGDYGGKLSPDAQEFWQNRKQPHHSNFQPRTDSGQLVEGAPDYSQAQPRETEAQYIERTLEPLRTQNRTELQRILDSGARNRGEVYNRTNKRLAKQYAEAEKEARAEYQKIPIETELAASHIDKPKVEATESYGSKNSLITKDEAATAIDRIKQRRKTERGSGGPSSEELQDYLTVAAYHVEAGAREFSDFAKRMTEDLGEWVKPHLEDLHDQALKLLGKEKPENANPPDINTETQTAKGNADAKAADASRLLEERAAQTKPTEGISKPAESLSTGIKKAAVADERTARNESPVEVEGKRTFGDVWERAKQKIDSGESDPASLAKQISEKPRPLSAEESATLIHDRVRLQNAERQTMAQIEEAGKAGNETAEIEARTRLKDIRERLDLNDQAAEKAGYEQGLGLSIRRMMAKEDYSLARLEQRARIASGSEVSDAPRTKLEAISKQLEDAEKALSGKDARIKELEANRQVDGVIKREQRRASRATTKEALDTEFAQLKTEFAAARKEVTNVSGSGLASLDPEGKLTPIILKMAKNRIKAGATTAEQLVDDVFNALKEHVADLKPRDVRDAISGYGVTAEMSKAEGAARLRELKRQMRLSSALEDAQAGQRPLKTGLVREPESAKVRVLKTQLNEVLKQQGIRPEMTPDQKAAAVRSRLQADINDLDRRIKSGDFSETKKTTISTPEIEQLKARRAELKKQYDDLKPEKDKPPRDPMPAIKTRLQNEIADLERRFAENDFSKPKKRAQLVYDEQAQVLKARRDALRQQADTVIKKLELANRSNAEKAADFIVKARRAILLSSVGTLGKLTAAASGRLILTPVESVVGEGLAKIPGIKSIAEKAPREGGFNAEAERAGTSKLFSKETLSQAKQVAKTGMSDLDILYGGKQAGESEAIEVFGRIHGAIKYPAKRAEFFKSLEYRAAHERMRLIKEGATPEQADAHLQRPDVQASLAGSAYEDAQRAILMNDNLAVTAYRGMINKLKTVGEEGSTTSAIGKFVARGAEFMLPVVKVPTNFVAEASSYAAGAPKAAIQLAVARGVDNLTPKQADYIMRNLKKQTVGAGLMALGYFATQSVGGYYQEGESGRTPEPGTLKLFGVKIPKMLLHTPAVEALQIGATIRRTHDAVMRKGGGQIGGFIEGAKAAGEGLAHEVPFFEAPARATKAGFEKFAGEIVRSFIIPPDVQNAARFFDKDEQGRKMTRYPKNLGEEIMVGVPDAREEVAGRAQVERSAAGVLAHKYLVEGLPKPERTVQETERLDMKQQIRESLAKGNQEPLREAKREGRITEREFDELKGEAKHSEIENDVKRLPIDEAFDVWDAALPDERQKLKPIIREKYLRAKANTPKAQWPGVQQRYQQAIDQ